MISIFKYPIPIQDTITLDMPAGAEVLTVQVQRGKPCIWAKVDTSRPMEDRVFYLRGTGQMFNGKEGRHVGSFQMDGEYLVFHLFEEKK
jgi:hypothetical protein